MPSHLAEIFGTVFFGLAILHTFSANSIAKLAHRAPEESFTRRWLHLFSEVEVVFGIWAVLLLALIAGFNGLGSLQDYQKQLDFTEPLFVFCVMVVAGSDPVVKFVEAWILRFSDGLQKLFRTPRVPTEIFVILTLGPLTGSFITEPAAMTVTALLLRARLKPLGNRLAYFLLAVLFVNVSIGGSLTDYAAPPILMVAGRWGWGAAEVFRLFGWKSLLSVFLSSAFIAIFFRRDLEKAALEAPPSFSTRIGVKSRLWLATHLLVLALVVMTHHSAALFMGLFLIFLALHSLSGRGGPRLRVEESFKVGFFLGGIVVFGPLQNWWLAPLVSSLSDFALYQWATGLTGLIDNAALTYLGSQVQNLSESSKYALVAGAITGGGLTIFANAPNPAGWGILRPLMPGQRLRALNLLLAALVPTAITVVCLWFLG